MSKRFETVAKWLDKLHYVETPERTCRNVPDEYWLEGDDECFTCSECGARMYLESESLRTCSEDHVSYCYNCGAKVVGE